MKCKHCGVEFKPRRRSRQYCSRECYSAEKENQTIFTCKHCGKEFRYKHNSKNIYCSNECKFADKQEWRKRYIGRTNVKQLELNLFIRYCSYCGSVIVSSNPNAKICGSDECKELQRREYDLNRNPHRRTREHRCLECGLVFATEYGVKFRYYCSDDCRMRAHRIRAKGVRRARKKTDGVINRIDSMKVFERDNWICYLCGKEAPRELRGTTDDMAPELEHVVPLSRGGTHTEDNCRCAHRLCNQIKGAALLQELMDQGDMASAIFPAISL